MKRKYRFLASAALATLLLAACNNETVEQNVSDELELTAESRIIVDELQREVEINSTERVVMGSVLPYFSTWFVATNSTDEIVGIHPNSYNAAAHSILKEISPSITDAKTNFIENGEVNVEQLMTLEPDVFFEAAAQEKTVNKLV